MTETSRSPYLSLDDADYAAASAAWNLSCQHRPALVTEPRSADEVVEAVRHATQRGLRVGIQTTGHGPCLVSDENAMLLSLRAMREFTIHPERAEATLSGGVQWVDMVDAAQDHGLAPLLGSAPHTGAVGYTLGGGSGWLARPHGLAVDRVRSLTVVLADGSVVTATPDTEPDLFWALCGAGTGGLGVVVEMTVGLASVSEVYAGNLLYPPEAAADVFGFWRDWIRDVPQEMTSSLTIMAFPALELVPPPLRGKTFTLVRGCYAGDEAEGAALVDRVRRWRPPVMDMFGPMSFRQNGAISQDPVDPVPGTSSGRWLADADTSTCAAMLDFVEGGGLVAELRHSGGAVRTPNPAVSFAARDAEFLIAGVALTPTPESRTAALAGLDQVHAATAGHHARLPGYLNFVEFEERQRMLTQAFDAPARQRLAEVKRAVDPGNLFGYGLALVD